VTAVRYKKKVWNALGWTTETLELSPRLGEGICFFSNVSMQTPKKLVPAAFPAWVRRPGSHADHSRSSAEVLNARNYTSTPTLSFNAWCVVKCTGAITVTVGFLRKQGKKLFESDLNPWRKSLLRRRFQKRLCVHEQTNIKYTQLLSIDYALCSEDKNRRQTRNVPIISRCSNIRLGISPREFQLFLRINDILYRRHRVALP
jgi:hypothetical protein